MERRRTLIIQLALATIVFMPLVAVVIDRFSTTVHLAAALTGTEPLWLQGLAGVILGTITAFGALFIITRRFMKETNVRYANMLSGFQLSWNEIFFVSVCAGVGEEVLFRGALQPLLGVATTSVLFVAIHGYLNPRDWRITIYGLFMTMAMVVIGITAATVGLLSAIIAHTLIDIVLLRYLVQSIPKKKPSLEIPEGDDQLSQNV